MRIAQKNLPDPRKIAYLAPRIPAHRLLSISNDWYQDRAIQAAEDVAAMFGFLLVPAPCINPKRRRRDRRMMIFGRTYYVLDPDDMTDMELAKYQLYLQGE